MEISECTDTTLAATLYLNLQKSKLLFDQKLAAFISLSELYTMKVVIWNKENRDLRRIGANKEVICVYRQNQKKGQFVKHDGWMFC